MTKLDQMMNNLLLKLEMLAYWGKTTSWNPSVSSSAEAASVRRPAGDRELPHISFRKRYNETESPIGRLKIYMEAHALVEELSQTKDVEIKEETAEQRSRRMLSEGEGWSARDVANYFRCSATEVRRIRAEGGCDPESGMYTQDLNVLELYEKKVPMREIARLVGKSYTTVNRMIRRAEV
jgi:DNA-directed RNA polymerase specialized sigma24 family protein